MTRECTKTSYIKVDVAQYCWFDLIVQLTHQVINKCNSIALFLLNGENKDGHSELSFVEFLRFSNQKFQLKGGVPDDIESHKLRKSDFQGIVEHAISLQMSTEKCETMLN